MSDLDESSLRLCSVCHAFDIRDMLLAAEGGALHSETSWDRLDPSHFEQASRLVFKHHKGLSSVRSNAAHCDLCSVIWNCLTTDGATAESILASDIKYRQVYLGCTTAKDAGDHLPKVVAFQYRDYEIGRVLALFNVYADRGQVPSDHSDLVARSIADYSGSDECLSLARGWLETCLKKHKQCRIGSDSITFPTRILDTQGHHPCLIDGVGHHGPFAALSYCWGGESDLILTSANQSRLRQGLPLEKFPRTMRDAIIVTRKLGLRFLWIDALCIFQDSSQDWTIEAGKMRDVYRGAVVTIAAASAATSNQGIFRHRNQKAIKLRWRNEGAMNEYVYLGEDSGLTYEQLRHSPISRRGWTLQETLLARRTLWMSEHQIIFECSRGQKDETGRSYNSTEIYRSKSAMSGMAFLGPQLRPIYKILRWFEVPPVVFVPWFRLGSYFLSRPTDWEKSLWPKWVIFLMRPIATQGFVYGPFRERLTFYDHWREVVQEYSQRRLTKMSDIFPALSGLANEFRRVTGDEYIAGMWRHDIIRSLSWRRWVPTDDDSQMRDDVFENLTQRQYVAPSWSWASIPEGRICFSPGFNARQSKYWPVESAKIIDVWVKPALAESPYASLADGQLILHAPLLEIDNPLSEPDSSRNVPGIQKYIRHFVTDRSTDEGYEFIMSHQECEGQAFALLRTSIQKEVNAQHPTTEAQILLIESCSGAQVGLWRRLGHFHPRLEGPFSAWDGEALREELRTAKWVSKTVTLI